MEYNLTEGSITGKLLKFAFPLMIGNLLQQCYNIADTLIVGRFLGADALAAVGSAYTLMVFLTSIILGLCMGSSAFFSMQYGAGNTERLKKSFFLSFVLIGAITLLLNLIVVWKLGLIIRLLQIPAEIQGLMRDYLWIIFMGLIATFLYNYFANLLRAVGNSMVPLIFLAFSAVLNIILDLVFVLIFHWGVKGAAGATVFSQYVSGVGILLYYYVKFPHLRVERCHMKWDSSILKEITGLSVLTCMQQSIMNLGILMVQGLVNSFGNAFSTFVAQNFGAGKKERIRKGTRSAVTLSCVFCFVVSALVFIFAAPLMKIFIEASRPDIIEIGVGYLRIEGSFYFGIGVLFLLYGYYRAVNKPAMSVVLTVISLGTRVVLAYVLSAVPAIGVKGIWAAVPIGWVLADLTGLLYMRKTSRFLQGE